MSTTCPGIGRPVQHKRRRKLANGYRYDSANHVISPNGHLVFARRDGPRTVYVEGDMVALWDSMEEFKRLAQKLIRARKGKAITIGVSS